jgi:hypothetical protein
MTLAFEPSTELRDHLRRLAAVDARIDAVAPARRSLSPERRRAHALITVAERHVRDDRPLDRAFVAGLAEVGAAQVESFPGNLFWDFDAFAGSVYAQAERSSAPLVLLDEVCGIACRLMALFGALSPIRFRYVHDFMYGFDWARWVARDPAPRAEVGPYDMPFLRYVFRRGHELVDLIAGDDAKYGKLDAGAHRNPFAFSREPEGERRLFEELARLDLVPVPAWESAGRARWDRPYAELREAQARALGLG